jgi:Flp pilus assembly protein TadD
MPVRLLNLSRVHVLACWALGAAALLLPGCASTDSEQVEAVDEVVLVEVVKVPEPVMAPPVVKVPTMAEARLLVEAGRYAEAVPALIAITEREPQNAEAWFSLGYSLHSLGRLEEAIVAHERAAEFMQVRPTALYNLGCAHALLGDPDAAFAALDRAVAAGFNNLGVMQEDSDLKSLHGDARWAALVASVKTGAAQG